MLKTLSGFRHLTTVKRFFLTVILLCAAGGGSLLQARQETPEPTPTPAVEDERMAELEKRLKVLEKMGEIAEKEKKIAEAEQSTAEAERKKFEAMLPKSETKALEGKVELDDKVTFESEILSHKAVSEVSDQISRKILELDTRPSTVVIYNDRDVNSLQYYKIVEAQIKGTTARYRTVFPQGGNEAGLAGLLMAPEAASAFLKSVVDVVSLFRTDTTIKGLNFTIDEVAVASQVSRSLAQRGVPVYYPALYLPNLFPENESADENTAQDSGILGSLTQLYLQKARAEAEVQRYESLPKEEKESDPGRPLVPVLKALDAQTEKFFDNLVKIDDTTGTNALTSLVRAEQLRQTLSDRNSSVLHVKVLRAAGTNMTKRNLFTGTKLYNSGGAVISYILFGRNGDIRVSGTYFYDGFMKPKQKDGVILSNLPSQQTKPADDDESK